MKKFLAIMLVLCTVMTFVACDKAEDVKVLSYDEYMAAEMDSQVVVEFYVQAAQGWWFDTDTNQGKITIYGQDKNGGYFAYETKCDEEFSKKLVPGTKVRVTGTKGTWAGEVEIMDGTIELVKNADTYIAEAKDLTDKLGTDDMIKYQNQFASFKGLTVVNVEYKNGEPGNDIYLTVSFNDKEFSFCVESYLTGPDSDVYKAVGALKAGDTIDVEGFVYWYEGINTHITAVTVK